MEQFLGESGGIDARALFEVSEDFGVAFRCGGGSEVEGIRHETSEEATGDAWGEGNGVTKEQVGDNRAS